MTEDSIIDDNKTWKKLLNKFNCLIIVVVFLLGIVLRVYSIGETNPFIVASGEVGSFLAVSATIALIYNLLVKAEDRKLFLSDMETVMDNKFEQHLNQKQNINLYDGRRAIDSKVNFIKNAQSEVIEVGISLNTFSGYFRQRPSKDFKDYIIELLKKGVNFKCIAINPNSSMAKEYAKDLNDTELLNRTQKSLEILKGLRDEFEKMGMLGKFEIYVSSHMPYFHSVCVDGDKNSGKIFVSPYLYNIPRAESPGIEFSKKECPEIFKKYRTSLYDLIKNSDQI